MELDPAHQSGMANKDQQPFRLLDLPGEIRNKIYQAILCSFEPTPTQASANAVLQSHDPSQKNLCTVTHSTETAILRTCKQVHHEAYDVMIKTNQFIKVTTIDITMSSLLLSFQIPIVTLDREHTEQFHGYIMSLTISPTISGWVGEPQDLDVESEDDMADWDEDVFAPSAGTGPRFNFMILGRDWEAFCAMLGWADVCIEDFSKAVKLVLHVHACAAEPSDLPVYKASIADFFTRKHQEALLKPFHTQISGFMTVSITGAVDDDLAQSAIAQVRCPLYTDPQAMFRDFHAIKASADALYTARDFMGATAKWSVAIVQLNRIHRSSSWRSLLRNGGRDFASAFEGLYFTTSTDCTQEKLRKMQIPSTPPATVIALGLEVIQAWGDYNHMSDNLKHNGSSYTPPVVLQIRYAYNLALCLRLMSVSSDSAEFSSNTLRRAGELIVDALRLAGPHDVVIMREVQLIRALTEEHRARTY